MRRRRILFLFVAALAVIAIAAGPALAGKCRSDRPKGHCGMTKGLGLDEKGKEKAAEIHAKYKEEHDELAEKMEALEEELGEIAAARDPDLGKLESTLKKLSELRFELTRLQFRGHKEIRALLDEDKRVDLDREFAKRVSCCGGMAGHHACLHGAGGGCGAGMRGHSGCGMGGHHAGMGCLGSIMGHAFGDGCRGWTKGRAGCCGMMNGRDVCLPKMVMGCGERMGKLGRVFCGPIAKCLERICCKSDHKCGAAERCVKMTVKCNPGCSEIEKMKCGGHGENRIEILIDEEAQGEAGAASM